MFENMILIIYLYTAVFSLAIYLLSMKSLQIDLYNNVDDLNLIIEYLKQNNKDIYDNTKFYRIFFICIVPILNILISLFILGIAIIYKLYCLNKIKFNLIKKIF